MRIGIVTDSTADIPPELVKQYQIRVVPAIIVMDGESFTDGEDISRQEFYERLPHLRTPATTATPSTGVFQEIYAKLFQEGAQAIFSLHVASQLSGIFDTAKIAAQSFGERVYVLDSTSLSMGIGFQVLAAAQAAAQELSVENILDHLQNFQKKIRVLAMLDTLEYIRRSGRVSWATARIGALLRVKLFVEISEGKVLNMGQARTRNKAIEHFKTMIHKLGPLEELAIMHTNAEADAHKLLADLALNLPSPIHVLNATPVIGTHVGPNGLGIAAVLK